MNRTTLTLHMTSPTASTDRTRPSQPEPSRSRANNRTAKTAKKRPNPPWESCKKRVLASLSLRRRKLFRKMPTRLHCRCTHAIPRATDTQNTSPSLISVNTMPSRHKPMKLLRLRLVSPLGVMTMCNHYCRAVKVTSQRTIIEFDPFDEIERGECVFSRR